MYPFSYQRPDTPRKAINLASKDEEAKFVAGGQTLLPTMKQRLASPSMLIDLARVDALRGIEIKGRNVVIGALTRHTDVNTSPEVREKIPALAELAGLIGDPAVRNKGTIGGSVANNDPAADYPAACLALNATIVTNKRKIAADDYFTGLFETALEPGELVTKISFPIPAKAAYMKFPNPASRYALVGVFVAKKGREVRVAVTGAGSDGVFHAVDFEAALTAKFHVSALEGVHAAPDNLISDIHADAEYRAHLIGVMTRRAVNKANGKQG